MSSRVLAGLIPRAEVALCVVRHGLVGSSFTQGPIASAVPSLGRARRQPIAGKRWRVLFPGRESTPRPDDTARRWDRGHRLAQSSRGRPGRPEAREGRPTIGAQVPNRLGRAQVVLAEVPQDAEGMGRGVKRVREEAPARG